MEKVILSSVFVLMWVALDTLILKGLFQLQESKLKQAMRVMQIELSEEWVNKRYRPLQSFRYSLLFSPLVSPWFGAVIAFGCLSYLIYMIPAYRIMHAAKKRIALVRYQFPIYLRQLQVLLQNNTVVKTIELSLDHIPSVLEKDIKELYQNIKEEPLELKHYLACMSQYQLPEVKRAMKWLYRYQSIGYQDAYRQFNRMIVSTSKWLRKSRLHNREQTSMVIQWLGMLPLVGVT